MIWKLGGTYDPGESLQIDGDAEAAMDLDSQHDVRVWPDGTVTVFSNGTRYQQRPRMLRFSIDYTGPGSGYVGTATLIQSMSFGPAASSLFVGSVRAVDPDDMSSTDWLIAWGGSQWVTEMTPAGQPVLTIGLGRRAIEPTAPCRSAHPS